MDPSLARAFVRWLHKSRRRRGTARTIAHVLAESVKLARDYTPARRRLRFGDLEYDWEHRVDTTWANVGLKTRLREIFSEGQYQPVDPAAFRESIAALGMGFHDFTFIDLGSGKGRALLLASDYPFRRIIGVELLPELAAIAQENLRCYRNPSQQCFAIELHCKDARDFQFPPQPTVLYLFNPFPPDVLDEVLTKVETSLREHPRKLIVLYHNPVLKEIVARRSWLQERAATTRYVIFANDSR